ncbi:unnamed protein product [Eruca vesicaria subsp. sativa]|uniref:Uncharacterized protein n=1 Tax=Eruca vesicaria subsp. sativa TaxID=29727 RepID=A0ABC8LLP0_ERUVS|nr:unnamed protein product [Eruca vesicaria subsp. sativa]
MRRLRRTSTLGGYESRSLMIFGGLDYRMGNSKSVVIGMYPTHPHVAIRDAIRCRNRRHRPFTNRMRDILRRRMNGLEPLSSDSESESESESETSETEEKLSEAIMTSSSTLPSSSMQEEDLQADAPPLKLEDVIPPTQSSSRNKKLVNKTTT